MKKLLKSFYLKPAVECVTDFLGKVLVHKTPQGRVSAIITDVEAYPAFSDEVHHGNKKTERTKVMWDEGGYAYVYLIYGSWHLVSAVVNRKDIPDVIMMRGGIPLEGIGIMQQQWDKEVPTGKLCDSPGKLCKSLLITNEHYGLNLTGDKLFFEDYGIKIDKKLIQIGKRIGIRSVYKGFDKPLRYFVDPKALKS